MPVLEKVAEIDSVPSRLHLRVKHLKIKRHAAGECVCTIRECTSDPVLHLPLGGSCVVPMAACEVCFSDEGSCVAPANEVDCTHHT